LGFSDAHYGDYMRLLAPGRGINMGDGWETRRRREPGYDWMIIALGARGEIEKAVIDTAHFKGNFPTRASIQAADLRNFGDGLTDALITDSMFWKELLPQQKLTAPMPSIPSATSWPPRPRHPCALQHLPRWRRVAPAPVRDDGCLSPHLRP
jgi:allantoicase